jgi:hypothetical protein
VYPAILRKTPPKCVHHLPDRPSTPRP